MTPSSPTIRFQSKEYIYEPLLKDRSNKELDPVQPDGVSIESIALEKCEKQSSPSDLIKQLLMPKEEQKTHAFVFSKSRFTYNLTSTMLRADFGSVQVPSLMSCVPSSKTLNGDEIVEVLQSEVAFTIATDKKPIVATYGAGSCIALGGYDPTNHMAFIVHLAHAGEIIECGGRILFNISQIAKKKLEKPIQIHLRGGSLTETSELTVKAIKNWMTRREDIPMEISSEDILNTDFSPSASLLIDSRTGLVAKYNPMDNPKHREVSRSDELSARMSERYPNIRVVYRPK